MENKEPIRILIINGKMICGGVESFIMNLYRRIDRSKIQFDFLVHYKERFFYDDEIEKLGGKIYRLSFRNDNRFFKYKKDLKLFFKEHKEYKIVWGQMDGLMSVYLKQAKKYGNNVITIAHSHIAGAEKSLKGLIKRFFKKGVGKVADYRFACSTEAGKYLYGKKDFKIFPNAIDTKKFDFSQEKREKIRKEFSLPSNAFVIGHVGRFNEQKNHEFLIKIFNEVVKKDERAVLMLCGDGELKEKISMQVNALNLQDRVIFVGNVNNVNEFYSAFDVFVMPSLYEGLPVSGIEAQTSGLKCLFSDTITKETQLVVENVYFKSIKASPSEWAEKIISISVYKRESKRLEVAKTGYDVYDEISKLENFFWSLANENETQTNNK